MPQGGQKMHKDQQDQDRFHHLVHLGQIVDPAVPRGKSRDRKQHHQRIKRPVPDMCGQLNGLAVARRCIRHPAPQPQGQPPHHQRQNRTANDDMRPDHQAHRRDAAAFDAAPCLAHILAKDQLENDQQADDPMQQDLGSRIPLW